MEPATDSELRLREARLQGSEQALDALKQATRDLERKAADFDDSIRRLEQRQASHLRWTIGAIIGLAAILSAVAITMLLGEAAERRALDVRVAEASTGTQAAIERIEDALAAIERRADVTDSDIEAGRGATEALLQGFAALQRRIDDANHRTDLMLGRLDENIDTIRSDFSYLVEGGGIRSSFAGRIMLEPALEAFDDPFMSEVRSSVVAAGGRLRGGTLGITVPRREDQPEQWVVFALSPQFLTALSELVVGRGGRSDSAERLLRITSSESLISAFYDVDGWNTLIYAARNGHLTDFVLERRPMPEN